MLSLFFVSFVSVEDKSNSFLAIAAAYLNESVADMENQSMAFNYHSPLRYCEGFTFLLVRKYHTT